MILNFNQFRYFNFTQLNIFLYFNKINFSYYSEITGYVSSIFQIKSTERNGRKTHLFNFIMSNGEVTIQITAWNDLAFKYAALITETEQVKHLYIHI